MLTKYKFGPYVLSEAIVLSLFVSRHKSGA
jgi:hypothetical protein